MDRPADSAAPETEKCTPSRRPRGSNFHRIARFSTQIAQSRIAKSKKGTAKNAPLPIAIKRDFRSWDVAAADLRSTGDFELHGPPSRSERSPAPEWGVMNEHIISTPVVISRSPGVVEPLTVQLFAR